MSNTGRRARPPRKGKGKRSAAPPPSPLPDTIPTQPEHVRALERRLQAIELRKAGANYRQIGEQLGVSHTQARKDVMHCLRLTYRELATRAQRLIALEYERLERPMITLAKIVTEGPKTHGSRLYIDACEQWRKLSESRRRLLGLDKGRAGGGAEGEDDDDDRTAIDVPCIVIEVGRPRGLPDASSGG